METKEEVTDSLVIGVNIKSDIQTILFVVLKDGLELISNLSQKIRNHIKAEATPRHSPKEIYRVSEIPVTMNGGKVELTVRDIFEGNPVLNRDLLVNPNCLREFENIKIKRKALENR
jgi:acetoacetyl-CoA synthetase